MTQTPPIDPGDHLRLALSLAQRYGHAAPDPCRVLEVAVGALMVAAGGFQPVRGTWGAFAAASVTRAVRGEVGRQLREADRLVPLVYRAADGAEYDRPDLPHVEPTDRLMEQAAARAAAALPEIERRVVALRFGMEDGEPLTLEETGRRVGLPRQRVAQLEAQAIGRLRKVLVPGRPRARNRAAADRRLNPPFEDRSAA